MKVRKKVTIMIVCIMIILLIATITILLITKNSRLISELENLAKKNGNITNYSYTMNTVSIDGSYISNSKYWIKDDAFLANISGFEKGIKLSEAEVYEDKNNEIYLVKRADGSTYYSINGISNSKLSMKCVPIKLYEDNSIYYFDIKTNFQYIIEDNFMEKECYLVQTKEPRKYWIEKDTGFVIGWTMGNSIISISYNIGNVTNSDIQIPDTSKYKGY